jgi:transcriptional regulator GlxA family with amidase domain
LAAEDLVRTPRIPIKDIGYAVGFKSAAHFTRAFQSAYEISPKEMRASGFVHTAR